MLARTCVEASGGQFEHFFKFDVYVCMFVNL
jgi:hypothetical protein